MNNYKTINAGVFTLAFIVLLMLSPTTNAQSDLAKQFHNPLGSLTELPMQLDVDFNIGDEYRTGYTYTFQPIFPIKLSTEWTLVSYTILPITSIPGTSDDRYSSKK